MSDEPLIQMRFTKRHHHYNAGELAAFPLSAARQLHALRVAEGVAELVRQKPPDGAEPAPVRQPASVVRK